MPLTTFSIAETIDKANYPQMEGQSAVQLMSQESAKMEQLEKKLTDTKAMLLALTLLNQQLTKTNLTCISENEKLRQTKERQVRMSVAGLVGFTLTSPAYFVFFLSFSTLTFVAIALVLIGLYSLIKNYFNILDMQATEAQITQNENTIATNQTLIETNEYKIKEIETITIPDVDTQLNLAHLSMTKYLLLSDANTEEQRTSIDSITTSANSNSFFAPPLVNNILPSAPIPSTPPPVYGSWI